MSAISLSPSDARPDCCGSLFGSVAVTADIAAFVAAFVLGAPELALPLALIAIGYGVAAVLYEWLNW
jgi:hypothetical protein